MKLGGVVGRMEIVGVPDLLWPWLRLGELVHVGKGTSFGLGRYRVKIQ
jgi:CRISPR/Cas system endoribonuclease Cas6 (RAMP superfamily)